MPTSWFGAFLWGLIISGILVILTHELLMMLCALLIMWVLAPGSRSREHVEHEAQMKVHRVARPDSVGSTPAALGDCPICGKKAADCIYYAHSLKTGIPLKWGVNPFQE